MEAKWGHASVAGNRAGKSWFYILNKWHFRTLTLLCVRLCYKHLYYFIFFPECSSYYYHALLYMKEVNPEKLTFPRSTATIVHALTIELYSLWNISTLQTSTETSVRISQISNTPLLLKGIHCRYCWSLLLPPFHSLIFLSLAWGLVQFLVEKLRLFSHASWALLT